MHPAAWQDELLPDHPQASSVQTLGLLSLLLSLVGLGIVAPFALARAQRVRKEIATRPGLYRVDGPARTGWTLALIGTILFGCATLVLVVGVALYLAASS